MAEQQQDVETLKKRGRRRLVGAVALVLLAVIILPMVFDPEPRPTAPPVSARIPGEDETPFKPKAKPQPTPEPKAEISKPEPKPEARPEPKPEPKLVAKPEPKEKARAEAALAGTEYFIQVGAFSDTDSVIAKLKAAKIPYFTEPLKDITRVRAGPFPSQDAAEKVLLKLRSMGFKPGPVATKSG